MEISRRKYLRIKEGLHESSAILSNLYTQKLLETKRAKHSTCDLSNPNIPGCIGTGAFFSTVFVQCWTESTVYLCLKTLQFLPTPRVTNWNKEIVKNCTELWHFQSTPCGMPREGRKVLCLAVIDNLSETTYHLSWHLPGKCPHKTKESHI
jgi:hypothetical protein